MISNVVNRSVESLRDSWQGLIGFALALGALQALVGLVAAIPLERMVDGSIEPTDITMSEALLAAATSLVVFAVSLVLTSALIVMVADSARGTAPDSVTAIRTVLGRGWVVVGSVIAASILVFVGLLLLIVPGIWIAVLMMPLLAVVLDGDEGVVPSIRTSIGLVRGSWWPVFGLILILAAISIVLGIVGGFGGLVGLFLTIIVNAITALIMATVIWFTYQELRRMRDWPQSG